MSEKSLAEKRILVVDDAPFNTRVLATALVDDYTVTFARGGVEALEMAGTAPQPDMILLDLLMADMDGFEVCARLKASAETAAIPVIFVTGLDDKINEERGFKLGGVDYIPKPINPAVVRARNCIYACRTIVCSSRAWKTAPSRISIRRARRRADSCVHRTPVTRARIRVHD